LPISTYSLNKQLTHDTFDKKNVHNHSALAYPVSLRARGRLDLSVRKHDASQDIYLPWHSAFVSDPVLKAILCYACLFTRVFIVDQQEENRKTAAQLKQTQ